MTTVTDTRPATPKQLWALFCLTKQDHRDKCLTITQASELISSLKSGNSTGSVNATKKDEWQDLWDKAYQAGVDAANACDPKPMIVTEHDNPLDDNSAIKKAYYVDQGVCGFAWVIVKPGNGKFANWLKKNGLARPDSYYGGVNIWISEYGQSYEKKSAHARAMASVFSEAGIKAYSGSRLD